MQIPYVKDLQHGVIIKAMLAVLCKIQTTFSTDCTSKQTVQQFLTKSHIIVKEPVPLPKLLPLPRIFSHGNGKGKMLLFLNFIFSTSF